MEKLTHVSFKLTDNSKVRAFNQHYNTFSLASGLPEHGGTCVGATRGDGGCLEKCYDGNLRKLYKKYADVEDLNTSLVLNKPYHVQRDIISNTVDKFWLLSGHTAPYFRIHTGGEFYGISYTLAWASVIHEKKHIKFWAYTRALFAVPILAELDNLTLFISCDPVNKDKALETYSKYKDYPNVSLAWMGNETPDDFPTDKAKLVCPEVTGKTKKLGSLGACARCRACIDRPLKTGKIRHLQFPIHR